MPAVFGNGFSSLSKMLTAHHEMKRNYIDLGNFRSTSGLKSAG